MSSKNTQKIIKSPRSKSPVKIKQEIKIVKKKPVKNTFDLIQFKKMLGKEMVMI